MVLEVEERRQATGGYERKLMGIHLLDFLAEVSEPHHTSWAGPAVEMMKRTTTTTMANSSSCVSQGTWHFPPCGRPVGR